MISHEAISVRYILTPDSGNEVKGDSDKVIFSYVGNA